MSEEHNADEMGKSEHTASVNRRRFVKALGAAGIASVGASNVVGASDGENIARIDESTIEQVSGSESKKAAANARSADLFKKLRRYLHQEYNYRVDSSQEQVLRVESPSGKTYYAVEFQVERNGSPSNVSLSQASTAIVLRNQQALRAKAVVAEERGKNKIQMSGDDSDTIVTAIRVEDDGISEESKQVPNEEPSFGGGGFTTQATPASCSQCVAIANAINSIGCGFGAAVVCSAAGLATIGVGGVVCAAVTYAICGRGVTNRNARAQCQVIGDC